MKNKIIAFLTTLFIISYTLPSFAGGSSFYGDNGAISTPTSEVKDKQFDIGMTYMKGERSYILTGTPNLIYSFNMNIFPFLEVGLSYNQTFTGKQDPDNAYLKNSSFDRSAFAKLQILKESDFIPSLSIGGRDIISNSVINYRGPLLTTHQQSFYGVIGKKLYDFDINIGYAYSPTRPIGLVKNTVEAAEIFFANSFRLNGFFGSLETPLFLNYFSGLIEYDSKYFNYGIRFSNFYGLDIKACMIDINNFNMRVSFNNKI